MPGRGAYQKQIAAIVAAATVEKLTIDDILPAEVRDHFKESSDLKRAQEQIAELQCRETALQGEIMELKTDLESKRRKIANLPADHLTRQTELQQAIRQIEREKQISKNLAERLERYQQQLKDNIGKQHADVTAAGKLEDLQSEIEQQQAVITKLMGDNRETIAMFEKSQEADKNQLERKCNQLAKKDSQLAEKDALVDQLHQQIEDAHDVISTLEELDPLALEEQNVSLMSKNQSLTEDNKALQEQYNIVKEQLGEVLAIPYGTSHGFDRKARLFSAVVAETKMLNRFFVNGFQVLDALSCSFFAKEGEIPSRLEIENYLDGAQEALGDYADVKKAVRIVPDRTGEYDPDQVALCKELDSMAISAADAMESLEMLHVGFWVWLDRMSDDPKMLSGLNWVLCDEGRLRAPDVRRRLNEA
ncbi:hypothetical protein E8E13_004163 [Curvularia kusanoi]|uniref:Uncharacterized protein n=1 Tax=Curvularia kusanoi TaxID=90978 RepID=A0A9P4T9M1_CURKU|nr:hypothetical protein E8E13_004163 [Curvularia kusanoi]